MFFKKVLSSTSPSNDTQATGLKLRTLAAAPAPFPDDYVIPKSEINSQGATTKKTALHQAILRLVLPETTRDQRKIQKEKIILLLQAGADLVLPDAKDETPLKRWISAMDQELLTLWIDVVMSSKLDTSEQILRLRQLNSVPPAQVKELPWTAYDQRTLNLIAYVLEQHLKTPALPSEVKLSCRNGDGLFATQDLEPGQIAGVFYGLFLPRPIANPHFDIRITQGEDTQVGVCTFNHDLVENKRHNAFFANIGQPNATISRLGPMIFLTCLSPIAKGEEVLWLYHQNHPGVSAEQYQLSPTSLQKEILMIMTLSIDKGRKLIQDILDRKDTTTVKTSLNYLYIVEANNWATLLNTGNHPFVIFMKTEMEKEFNKMSKKDGDNLIEVFLNPTTTVSPANKKMLKRVEIAYQKTLT